MQEYFKIKMGMEPSSVINLMNLPEENPTHFIYEVSAGDKVQKMVAELIPADNGGYNGLMVRFIESEEELNAIRDTIKEK